ncbi:NAD(P)H-dependent oxidoreductase [Spirosoma aureum]|uniref:NAD(P)H-dependent oxidoreductase n=1 Tax=Spirosoma aureum TaxID=2692134 RepID=A0A6G9AM54_9BACT|nr:NAD(P)H-dependent oxidoreductase [Spirosoma aureum]QIP13572.1 NAD(P)H-dependent oxidoreductase [Spirosoma aureum]
MKTVFVINGGQKFAHSGGAFNETLTGWTLDFLRQHPEFDVKVTNINDEYDPFEEVKKYVWADIVIYHTPVWWFQLPYRMKEYLDRVFTAGHQQGIYTSDGRSRKNPAVNYGTGGTLHGRHYMLTTSWNAPKEAFTLPGEFFNQKSVDEGVMFGFHRMNAFTGMEPLESIHFHDVEKNVNIARDKLLYRAHLEKVLIGQSVVAI